jgi:hypothetical protein
VSAEALTRRLKCLPVLAVSFDFYINVLARLGQVLGVRPTGRWISCNNVLGLVGTLHVEGGHVL